MVNMGKDYDVYHLGRNLERFHIMEENGPLAPDIE